MLYIRYIVLTGMFVTVCRRPRDRSTRWSTTWTSPRSSREGETIHFTHLAAQAERRGDQVIFRVRAAREPTLIVIQRVRRIAHAK